MLCLKQSIGSDHYFDDATSSSEALSLKQGGAHLDSEKGRKLRVGSDLARP
jgi:hypothetical protein